MDSRSVYISQDGDSEMLQHRCRKCPVDGRDVSMEEDGVPVPVEVKTLPYQSHDILKVYLFEIHTYCFTYYTEGKTLLMT